MKKVGFLTIILFSATLAMGTHLRCGYITARPFNCSSKEYSITVTVYTNTGSDVKFGEDGILNFGDGTPNFTVPAVAIIPRPDLGPDIGMAQYTIRHTYSTFGSFLISYIEPNRNGGVRNMDNSFSTTFYTETRISLQPELGCTTSPEFLTPPILQAAANIPFTYSLAATSLVDNLVTYELVVPFRDRGLPLVGYVSPSNLAINYLTGLLTWDTRFQGSSAQPGEYNFAVQVNQHVKAGETYSKVSFIRIDFQVIVNGDVSDPVVVQDNQQLDEYNRLLVREGNEKKIKIFFESAENSSLQAFSELSGNEIFAFETYDSTHETSAFKVGVITVKPNAAIVRDNPYLITVRAKSGVLGSDINYLIYTDEILNVPVITPIEKDVDEFSVYPNPAHEKITVRLNGDGFYNLTLFNLEGKHVRSKSFESEGEVNLSDLLPGIYICEIRRNDTFVRRIKVIKTQ